MQDMPKWVLNAAAQARTRSPKLAGKPAGVHILPGQASPTAAAAIRMQAASTSHNTFRPDVYRVSEGYLN